MAIVPGLTTMSSNFLIPTTQQWSLGIQRELPWNQALDASYVGIHGTHLLRAVRINHTPPGTTATPTNAFATYRGYGTITERQTSGTSRYDAFQLALNKRMSRGFQFGLAYTFSTALTDSPDDRTTLPQDFRSLSAEHALALFDKTHIFVLNYIWELPFFKNGNKFMYNILGGWQVGGIYCAESGIPLTVGISPNQANFFFGGTQRPNLVGDLAGAQTVASWFNTAAFALPTLNTFGSAGRSLVRRPGVNLMALSLFKNFRVTEAVRMQFRAEFFNVFNHVNLSGVGTNFGSTTYGQVTSALEPRQIQLGLKLNF